MTRALYPGTFDPITNGHVDLIHRASRLFDELIIAVAASKRKGSFFTLAERTRLVKESIKGVDNVRVVSFKGLLADEFATHKVDVVIRGLRAGASKLDIMLRRYGNDVSINVLARTGEGGVVVTL